MGFGVQPNFVTALALDGTGRLYVGGEFNSYNFGADTYGSILQLESDATVNPTFAVGIGFPYAGGGMVNTILPAQDGTGDVFVGGAFINHFQGTEVGHNLVRLSPLGALR